MTSNPNNSSNTPTAASPTAAPGARSSYANATRGKQLSPPAVALSNPPAIVGGSAPPQHAKNNPVSPVNGKAPVQPAIPAAMSGPAIVNSSSVANGAPSQGDHSRKPSSITITPQGTTGYIPNGGSAGPNTRPPISFGSIDSSPAVANSLPNPQQSTLGAPLSNPAPARTPSPIPQPGGTSGGRPPQGLQGSLAFGSMPNTDGGDVSVSCNTFYAHNTFSLNYHNTDMTRKSRPSSLPQTGPANAQIPQPQHLRRDSSHSAHSDLSSANRNFTPNGRGRGYTQPFASPAPGAQQLYRGPMMAHQRPPNAQPYPQQLPLRPQHTNSPYQSNRTPTMGMQQPHMNGPPMQPQGPYAYTQQYQPQVRSSHSYPFPFTQSYTTLPPEQARLFLGINIAYLLADQDLTYSQAQTIYGMPQQLDPTYGFYNPQFMHHGMPGIQYPGAPPSPRPFNAGQQPYMPGPYGVPPPQVMSRTSSQGPERPGSTVGASSTPGVSTAPPPPAPGPGTGSPAQQTSSFQRPTEPRKSKAIAIKRPDGTEVTVDKATVTSPPSQPASRGPVIVSSSTGTPSVSTPTPPPAPVHVRTESQHAKSADERRQEFTEQFKKQLEAEKDDEKPNEDEEPKPATTEEEATPNVFEEETAEVVEEKEPEKPLAESKPVEEAPKDEAKSAEDEEMERMIAEMEAQEREEEERERKYNEKKKKDAEEKAKQEAEAKAKLDEELKRQEREAEELEEAREREREDGNVDDESAKLFATLKRSVFGPGASATPESGTSTPAAESPIPEPAVPVQLPQPKATTPGGKPKPAALKLETTASVEPAQPTAGMQSLKSARFLQVQNESITYPEGIKSPNPALNQGKTRGRKYDKEFLLQFQEVFKEKPSIDWDKKIKDTLGDGTDSARPPSARTPSMGGRQTSRPAGMPGITSGAMGSFGATGRTLPPGTTSDQRFHASIQQAGRGGSMPNPFAPFGGRPGAPFPMGAPPMMVRTGSSQSIPQQALNSPRTASSRGKGSRRGGPGGPSAAQEAQLAKNMPLTAGQQLKPLEISGSGWKPQSLTSLGPNPVLPGNHMPPDMVQRKVKAALNKMTPEKFEKISGDILNIAMQSKDEQDGRTLRQVIQLTFEKACDEAHWASMYAKFCKRMLEEMSQEIKDDTIHDKSGAPVVGGALFRKYLLNRCQEEFERGWEVNLPEKPEGQTEEAVMLSDEYYVAAAAKRRGLGLIQFIGELYKLNMLTIRIMHECVFRLLNFEGLPDESAIESLVKLLRTVGYAMEQAQLGPQMLNSYFERINVIMAMEGLPSRLYYMLLDTVDLRKSNWKSKDDAKGPKTIQEIREDAAAQQAAAEAERARQSQRGGPRPPVGRGDARSFSSGGMMPPPDYPRNQVGMDDLKRLTRGARPAGQVPGVSLGPTSMLGSRSSSGRKGGLGPLSRGAEDSGASSRTNTPPVKEKESTAHINAYRLVEHPQIVRLREEREIIGSSKHYVPPPTKTNNAFSALAGLDAGEGADDVASPPSAASSPPVAKSQPAIAEAVSDETSKADAAPPS